MSSQHETHGAQPGHSTDLPDGFVPGEVLTGYDPIIVNAGRESVSIAVTNAGDRPIQVGSHFHFFEVNKSLSFDRSRAYGRRLDIPSGSAVRFEPGETRPVSLIDLGGARQMWGCNGLVQGALDDPDVRATAHIRLRVAGFLDAGPDEAPPDA